MDCTGEREQTLLDENGHLSSAEWKKNKAKCAVRRFTAGEGDENGFLVDVGRGWHFDYDATDPDDYEPLYKLDRHVIKQGEYLSITEHDGVMRTFKIVHVYSPPEKDGAPEVLRSPDVERFDKIWDLLHGIDS